MTGDFNAPKYVLNYVGKSYGSKPTQEPDVKVMDILKVNMYLKCMFVRWGVGFSTVYLNQCEENSSKK